MADAEAIDLKREHEVFGANLRAALKKARLDAGLTQQEVSAISGINKSVISRIEQGGIKDPAFLTVAQLAYIYGVGLSRLARMARIHHTKEIETDVGWEAVDWRITAGIRTLLASEDNVWREAMIENFFAMTETKRRDEERLQRLLDVTSRMAVATFKKGEEVAATASGTPPTDDAPDSE